MAEPPAQKGRLPRAGERAEAVLNPAACPPPQSKGMPSSPGGVPPAGEGLPAPCAPPPLPEQQSLGKGQGGEVGL